MAVSWIQPSFSGGEIAPSLYGRIDMAKYQVALRKCDNFIVRQYGGVENRPGTQFIAAAKYPDRKCRLISVAGRRTRSQIANGLVAES